MATSCKKAFYETGNLRHFEVHYIDVRDLEKEISISDNECDGRVLVPVCETKQDLRLAKEFL